MPRNMSFSMTTQQFIDETKDVTRRKGWRFLKAGDLFMAVEKAMGLKKGEKMRRLGLCRAVSVRREPLSFITVEDVRREGFPTWTTLDFVNLYMEANGGDLDQEVTRIEFERVDEDILNVKKLSAGSGFKNVYATAEQMRWPFGLTRGNTPNDEDPR